MNGERELRRLFKGLKEIMLLAIGLSIGTKLYGKVEGWSYIRWGIDSWGG